MLDEHGQLFALHDVSENIERSHTRLRRFEASVLMGLELLSVQVTWCS